jgi:hypothetical protein
MGLEDIEDEVRNFPLEQRVRFLVRLSHELTSAARETYTPDTEEIASPRQLRAYNEMQHRVAACLWELLEAKTTEVWLWPFLSETSETCGCESSVTAACKRALRFILKV